MGVKIKVNEREIEVRKGTTILKACETIGLEIPRYCYSERLGIAGNCRMCVVEVEGVGKVVVSCSEEVREGMKVKTESSMIKKSREGVLEFLLLNHPLDCPICDQGGECDLQEESMRHGARKSRGYKRERKEEWEKDLGEVVSSGMTRCIECSRCVRYISEVCGEELGMLGRSKEVEVGRYRKERLRGRMRGNVIDLCPVGVVGVVKR